MRNKVQKKNYKRSQKSIKKIPIKRTVDKKEVYKNETIITNSYIFNNINKILIEYFVDPIIQALSTHFPDNKTFIFKSPHLDK